MFSRKANKIKITVEYTGDDGKPVIDTHYAAGYVCLSDVHYEHEGNLKSKIETQTNIISRPHIIDMMERVKLEIYLNMQPK